MKKTYSLITLLLFLVTQSFSQNKHKSITHDLPQNVIYDFAKAVNYSWNYADNTDAFKGALIPMLQRRGIYSPVDIERTIQDVGKSKNCRDLVLGALSDYTGLGRLNKILLNMDIPTNSARVLAAYAYQIQQQNQSNEANVTPSSTNTVAYIVTAQKTYFYSTDTKGGVGQKRQAYLVEGEKIIGSKEKDAYVYCVFTNSTTKRTSKGWICKMDIEELSNEASVVQINDIGINSPFNSLKKFDGEHQDVKKVYADPIIAGVLKTIMKADRATFMKDFLFSPLLGDVYIRHNVLYIRSFVMHNATTNASFFIDLKNGKSFLYWNTFDKNYNDLLKTYGDVPLSSGIINFIQLYKVDMKDFMDENDVNALDSVLKYQDGQPLNENSKTTPNTTTDKIYTSAEQVPEFPGGMEAFGKFLEVNLKYPSIAKDKNTHGRVVVSFVCEKDGSITEAKVLKGIGDGCDEEALKVIKLMPHWKPATKNGNVVRTTYSIPIAFILGEE